jgi:hypothetical protein
MGQPDVIAVAMGIVWAGYSVGIWGYCLVRGYDVPFTAVFKTAWPGGGTAAAKAAVPADPGTGTYNV